MIAVAVIAAWLASNVAIAAIGAGLERRVHAIERSRRLHPAAQATTVPFVPQPPAEVAAN